MNGKSEGYYSPATYLISAQAGPMEVSKEIFKTFNNTIKKEIDPQHSVVNTDTAIKIASIIQREARDKK